jgi:tetratricopeptide (TPR) repeat protein
VTEANLQICDQNHFINSISKCHHVLGDLDFDLGNYESARTHYESALKIARSISNRQVLIEALLACGMFYAKTAVGATHPARTHTVSGNTSMQDKTTDSIDGSPLPLTDAFTDLNEALNYAVEGGYRIYEADIRVALAWAYLASGEKVKAKQSAQRVLQMSQEMGYHWGKVDGEEVMNASREG